MYDVNFIMIIEYIIKNSFGTGQFPYKHTKNQQVN